MSTHTPGPWAFDGQEIWAPGDSAVNIAKMIGKQSLHTANAAFIVRACNAHEELLEACKAAFERLTDNDMIALGSKPACDRIYAAIAKAEGRG